MPDTPRMQQIRAMLHDEPDDPFLRYGLAMEHLGQGQDEEAVRCFHDLMGVAPDYVPAYLQAGQVLSRLGRLVEARAVLERGLAAARKQGDLHAAGELEGFLEGLED